MTRIHVYTSAAANYLPKVRVLFQTLRRFHPDWVMHLALADTPQAADTLAAVGADHVHQLDDLAIPHWRPWAFCHTLIELATAIKPFALKKILARPDCDAVLYFDPDIAVFADLGHLADAFAHADILLTPHITAPESTFAGIVEHEICTAQHGIYNLGFIGVAARDEGHAFADWWADRVYRFCQEEFRNGLYTDQRWVDFVPAFFDRVEILRHPGLNVAAWNLGTRRLTGDAVRGYLVNGKPLQFFHFSRVDSDANDPVIDRQPEAAGLVRWYRAEARAQSAAHGAPAQWGLSTFSNGAPILAEQRLVYGLRADLQHQFPDPFAAGAGSFAAWWDMHGPQEHPALFDPQTRATELSNLSLAMNRTGLSFEGLTAAEAQRNAKGQSTLRALLSRFLRAFQGRRANGS